MAATSFCFPAEYVPIRIPLEDRGEMDTFQNRNLNTFKTRMLSTSLKYHLFFKGN